MNMNREIKFRAWNGKWMSDASYGDWISFDGVPYTEADRKYNTPNIEIEKAKDYVLMQFTGLLDKNGKEIYEGDVVKSGYFARLAEVVFVKGGFFIKRNPSGEYTLLEWFNKKGLGSEVIGNIYENPELLKEDKQE